MIYLLQLIGKITAVLLFVFGAYQLLYIPIALFIRKKAAEAKETNSYAVLICARNEEAVIPDLISYTTAPRARLRFAVLSEQLYMNVKIQRKLAKAMRLKHFLMVFRRTIPTVLTVILFLTLTTCLTRHIFLK